MRFQESADVVVAAVEGVLDEAWGTAVDDADVRVHAKLKVATPQMGEAESLGPHAGFHGLLESCHDSQENVCMMSRETLGGSQERLMIGVLHQRRRRWRCR